MTETIDAVVAAVPTYNMAAYTLSLLPQLLEQGYDRVLVLDDHSDDQTAEKVRNKFGDSVEVVAGATNLGAAGNRNRIISALPPLGLGKEVIINFIDADTELLSSEIPLAQAARHLFAKHPDASMIGGLVQNVDGTWGAFNYGPVGFRDWLRSCPIELRLEPLSKSDPEKTRALYEHHRDKLKDWPNIFEAPVPRIVGHLIECFTFIRASTFEELGGYDVKLRYCEAIELGLRLRQKGLVSVFDSSVGIRHLQVDHRGWHRYEEVIRALVHIGARQLTSRYSG